MNKSSESYSINYCQPDDVPSLKRFINENWRLNHVMAQDHVLFEWQHRDHARNRYTFALAKNTKGEVVGVLGFIPSYLFSDKTNITSTSKRVVWLAVWKVLSSVAVPGLGLKLRDFIDQHEKPALLAAVGINPRTIPLYKAFGYQTGTMRQYYMINEAVQSPRLVYQVQELRSDATNCIKKNLLPVAAEDLTHYGDLWRHDDRLLPEKNHGYIKRRYAEHPRYTYNFYAVIEGETPTALLVVRVAPARETCALRIVDIIGPAKALSGLGKELQRLLELHSAEFIDVLNYGIDPIFFHQAGMLCNDPSGTTIIPVHFEPFEQVNVILNIAYKIAPEWRYVAFKGDGDQDRPGQLVPPTGAT
jgi:hypothetical protein